MASARQFDGVDDWIDWGDIAALDSLTKLTVSFWCYPDASGDAWFAWVTKYGTGQNGWTLQRRDSTRDILFEFDNGVDSWGAVDTDFWNDLTWNHFHVMYDGSQSGDANRLRFWHDGTEKTLTYFGAGSIPASLPNASNPLGFGHGAHDATVFYKGRLGRVVIWPGEAISNQNQITALKQSLDPRRVHPVKPEIWAPVWGAHSPEIDLSGKGHTGTVTGTTIVGGPPVTLFTPKWAATVTPAAFVPYPNPRYVLTGGMQPMSAGV